MHLSPDDIVLVKWGAIKLNATIVTTWAVMLILVLGAYAITRRLSSEPFKRSRWQNFLEIIIILMQKQIKDVGLKDSAKYFNFIASLFLFLAMANFLIIIPGYEPPTGSLSTTTALAICVFVIVPYYGVQKLSLLGYLKTFAEPTLLMLPFNIISEMSRTLALAVRLFGNMMSGSMILAILLTIAPLIFPVLMQVLGLLTGTVQAYIFSILALVYIAAATQTKKTTESSPENSPLSKKRE